MKPKVIIGDLVKDAFKYGAICHGANCYVTMGNGIAKTIREAYPQAYAADMTTIRGDINKLGNYTYAEQKWPVGGITYIFNLYTQFSYDASKKPFDYAAFELCLKKLALACELNELTLAIPLIGCDLGGGDMKRIMFTVFKELVDVDTTIYVFHKNIDAEETKIKIEKYYLEFIES
jgi:O-acetyl-ADP-ribose deacetylase (regulator of RNase III)